MKHFSIIIFLLFNIGLFSCRKLTTFKIKNSSDLTVPATGAGVSVIPSITKAVQTSSQNSFQNYGTDASHVKEIKLDQLSLTITTPGQNFDFVDKIHIYISASGVAEQEIAYLDPLPNNQATTIDLISTGILLDDYIKQDTYNIRVAATTNGLGNPQVDMRADMIFSVRATIHK